MAARVGPTSITASLPPWIANTGTFGKTVPGLPATGPWRPVPGMSNLPGQDQVVTYPAPLDVQQLYRVRTRLTPLP